MRTPDEALVSQFSMQLDKLMMNVSVERQNAGEQFRDTAEEFRDWARRTGHPLNAFADVLWHFAKYGEHGQGDVSAWLSDALGRWAQVVLNDAARAGSTSLRAFVQRAQGHTREGESIRWDRDAKRFESVPWSLENRHWDVLPPDSIEISDPTGLRLRALWQAARRSRCRVLENRAFNGPPNDAPWFCTMELRAAEDCDEGPILSIWENEFDAAGRLYMVEQRPRDAMDEHVRTWIEMVALKPEPQATWGP